MKNGIKTIGMWLIIGVIFIMLLSSIIDNPDSKMEYSDLLSKVQTGEVKSIEIRSNGKEALVELKDTKQPKTVVIPELQTFMTSINDNILSGEITVKETPESFIMAILRVIGRSPFISSSSTGIFVLVYESKPRWK